MAVVVFFFAVASNFSCRKIRYVARDEFYCSLSYFYFISLKCLKVYLVGHLTYNHMKGALQ